MSITCKDSVSHVRRRSRVSCESTYAIGKQTAYPEWDLYYIVNDDNEPLSFDNLDAAIDFLRTQLHVHHAELFLTAPPNRAI